MFVDYQNKEVNFFYVYSNIQHSETNGIVAPFSIDEKLIHISEVKRRSGSKIKWICDTMGNDLKKALHASPNAEFVLDPAGKVLRRRFWSDPTTLRKDLETLVGKVDNPTRVEDTKVRFKNESRPIASGIVPPVKLPSHLVPISTIPEKSKDNVPFFAKLRAEAETKLLSGEEGKLYLVLNVDPLHKVHWNNKVGQVKIKIKDSQGVVFSEQNLVGPKVDEPADIDPRQFLIDIKMDDKTVPIKLSVQYTVCDDAETFCLPVEQSYRLQIKKDEYGGTRPEIFLKQLFSDVEKFDANSDGILTANELPPGKVTLYIGHMDKNENGQVDPEEIVQFKEMFGNGKGFIR